MHPTIYSTTKHHLKAPKVCTLPNNMLCPKMVPSSYVLQLVYIMYQMYFFKHLKDTTGTAREQVQVILEICDPDP